MSTCVVHHRVVTGPIESVPKFTKFHDAYHGVGRAGELVIMREVVETIDGQPHHKAETLCVFAPGAWFSVTYEDADDQAK